VSSGARRSGLGALATLLALLAGAPGAPAQDDDFAVLPPEAAQRLTQILQGARQAQGVCYGYQFTLDDNFEGGVSRDVGSSGGVGVPVSTLPGCSRTVQLDAEIVYTSSTSEFEDSASVSVDTAIEGVNRDALQRLGYTSSDLVGDQDAQAAFNMVAALPVLVAEAGAAPYVPFDAAGPPRSPRARPSASPGSDFVRAAWPALTLGGLLVIGGIGLFVLDRLGILEQISHRQPGSQS